MALTAARAATTTWPIASAKKNTSGSCSPATSTNSPRCRLAKSCRSWPPVAGTTPTEKPAATVQSAASTVSSTPTVRPIGVADPNQHSNLPPYHGSGRPGRIRCAAGTSPTCPPPCEVCNCTSVWCSRSGAGRLWPGMSPSARIQPSQRIW